MLGVKWALRLLERDVVSGMWRGETAQVVYWDVEGRKNTGSVLGCGGEKQHM